MAQPNDSVEGYLVEFDDGLWLASIVANTPATFPINGAADLQHVFDDVVKRGAVDPEHDQDLRRILLSDWPDSAFPITSKYDLAWSVVMKYRMFATVARPPDPRIVIGRFPPHRPPWPRR